MERVAFNGIAFLGCQNVNISGYTLSVLPFFVNENNSYCARVQFLIFNINIITKTINNNSNFVYTYVHMYKRRLVLLLLQLLLHVSLLSTED